MDTPFKDLLHTNTVPSDPECQRIRELLVGPREEAAKLTDEIAQLQTLLDELTAKRDRLNEFIEPHLALVSPARRLPDDVVAEIFTASLPYDRNSILSGVESPLLLCHICRTWRSLAFMTPRLWASLHIVAPSDSSKIGRLNDTVNLWFSRSGVLPLSISIVRPHPASDCDISMLLKTLIHYSPRWHRMRFVLDSPSSFEPLAALSSRDLPSLESVVVEGFQAYGFDDVDWSFISFLGTTSLRSVSLTQVVDPFRFPLSWDRLCHLSLQVGYVAANQVLNLLRRCLNLETCILSGGTTGNEVLVPCHMEHLRQLSISTQWYDMPNFFGNLVLPKLRTLEYTSQHNNSLLFIPLLHAPNCVRHLSLNMQYMPITDDLVDCLRLVPMLHELCLDGEPIRRMEGGWHIADDEFLTHLTPTIEDFDDTICPELRSIRLLDFYALSDTTLLEFVQARLLSRSGHPTPFSVDVQFKRLKQIDIRTSLNHLINNGLELTLNYFEPLSMAYSPSQRNQAHTAEWEPISATWGIDPSRRIS
ncbi:hypothetical protein C8R44DRAFT_254014 [Mycena epipterygia]|nr:hypothetical protein C8R44DRAFT_254014 [Mycena epipterygia]